MSEVLLDIIAVLEVARNGVKREAGYQHFRTGAVRSAKLRQENYLEVGTGNGYRRPRIL